MRLLINTGGWVALSELLNGEEESSPCPALRQSESGFSRWTHLKIVESWRGKGCNYPRSTDSVYIHLIVFPVEFTIFLVSFLIPAFVHILCAYTSEHFVLHLHSPFLVGSKWKSRWTFVRKVLSLRHQQAPRCQRNFLGTFCQILDEIFYSPSNWIWSKV